MTVDIGGKTVKLQIWDTAGQERFRTIQQSYYRGAHGVLVVYDTTDRESFHNVKNWLEEIDRYAAKNCCKAIVGTKIDLENKRAVSNAEAMEYFERLGIPLYETSAKTNINVREAFTGLATQALDRMRSTTLLVTDKNSTAGPDKNKPLLQPDKNNTKPKKSSGG